MDNEINDWVEVPVSKSDSEIDDWTEVPTENNITEEFSEPTQESDPKTSLFEDFLKTSEAAVKGAAKGFTANQANKLGAYAQQLYDDNFGSIGETNKKLRDQGFQIDEPSVYDRAFKENKEETKKLEEEMPIASMGGNIAGSALLTSLVPGLAPTSAMGMVGTGAALGGLEAAGDSEAADLAGLAGDTLKGATISGAIGAGIPVIGKGAGAAIDGVKKAIPQVGKLGKDVVSTVADFVDPKFSEHVSDAYDLGKRGIAVSGKKAEEALKQDKMRVANDVQHVIRDQFDEASKEFGNILSKNKNPEITNQIKELEERLINDDSLSNQAKDYIKYTINKLKKTKVEEEVISGQEVAQGKLNKLMEKAKGKHDVLGNKSEITQVDPTDDGNFLQALNTRLNTKGDKEIGRSVLQTAVPEDKIVKKTTSEFKDLTLSDLENLRKELANAANKNTNSLDISGQQLADASDEIDRLIQSSLSEQDSTASKYLNRRMMELHDIGEINPALKRSEHYARNADLDIKKLIEKGDDDVLDRIKQYGGLGTDLRNNIDDIRNRTDLLKESTRESSGVFDLAKKVPKSMAVRVANFSGKLNGMVDNTTSKLQLSQGLRTKGLDKLADQLESITPENKSKIMFLMSQQPEVRKLVDEYTTPELNREEEN